jgi:hypothetical protein
MKVQKGFRTSDDDMLRKPAKLAPALKSGKERHSMYDFDDQDSEDEDFGYPKRESILDYFDDGEDDD